MKQLQIQMSKCILVLYENELYQLPRDILVKGLQRGKGLKRTIANDKRQAQAFDKWELYEVLKQNRTIDDDTIRYVEVIPESELREGVIEYLLMKKQTTGN